MKVYDKLGHLLYDIDESKEIARGGEGKIIEVSNNKVAKIYLQNIKALDEKKFNELFELKSNNFIKPEVLLFNNKKEVIGFIMNKVPNNFFPLLSIFNKNFCTRLGITREIKNKIFERIITAIKFAHSKGIIIGDLNQYNLLINEDGMVYFIDVDSYETKNFKHTNVLLEEIRDSLYNGNVTMESDFFALAILYFNAFTYVHPFKGICKQIPKISDRMIHKKSILKKEKDIIIPKCYEEINDSLILEQLNRIFNEGERFLINIDLNIKNNNQIKNDNVSLIIKTNELLIHQLYSGDKIIISYNSKERLVLINEKQELIIYDVSLKGNFKEIYRKKDFYFKKNKIFVHKTKIYSLSDNKLIDLITNKELFTFNSKNLKSELFNDILIVITEENMFKFNLNKILNDKIEYSVIDIYGGNFNGMNSIFQNVSGCTVLFYEKNGLNSSVIKQRIKSLYQISNYGMFEMVENEKIKYKLFSIKNLKTEIFNSNYNELRMFDVLNDSIIVMPNDDYLSFIRAEDMQEIIHFDCNLVSNDSIIHCTNSGIILINNNSNNVYLINKK